MRKKEPRKEQPQGEGRQTPRVKPKDKPRVDRRKKAGLIFAAILGGMLIVGMIFQGIVGSNKTQTNGKNTSSQPAKTSLPPPPSTTEATKFLVASNKPPPKPSHSNSGEGNSNFNSNSNSGGNGGGSHSHGLHFFPATSSTQSNAQASPNKDVTGGYGLNAKQAKSGIFAFGGNGGGNMKPPPNDIQNLNTQIQQAKKLIEQRQNQNATAQKNQMNSYIQKLLAAQAARHGVGGGGGGGSGPTAQQQEQSNSKFLKNPGAQQSNTSAVTVTPPPKTPTLMPGSVIPAVLVSTINSDLPGQIVARTTSPVFDSVHERTLIIPMGSTLVGFYSSNVTSGQTRVLVSFKQVIFPNGTTVNLGGMSAADAYGQAGMGADVNSHFWKRFGASFLVAAISSLLPQSQYVTVINAGQNPSNALPNAAGQALSSIAKTDLQRYENLAPTLIVHRGFRFNVMVSKPISITDVERRQ